MPAAREQDGRGTLWLVPGHLGDVRDLGPRTVEVLGRAALWLVEPGSERAVARTAQLLRLTPPRRLPLRDGPQDEDALDAVLRALDDGQDVAVFGAEEGVVGWADPGSDLLDALQRARPDLPIRSVGGPSVLGTALMRVPRHLNHALVLGTVARLDARARERLTDVLRFGADDRLPTVWLVTGEVAKAVAAHVATMRPAMAVEAWLMARLTTPDEHVVHAVLGPDTSAAFADVDDDAPCTLVMVPGWGRDAWRSWLFRLRYRLWRGRARFQA